MEKIDAVRLANYIYADRCPNVVEVVAAENNEVVQMHLNASGLVEAIRKGVIVSAKKPDEKSIELLFNHLSMVCEDDIVQMKAVIINLLGE
ncbi:MAG: hypothetical protein E7012_02240 [Alphaproteobacteria bacterium]|nr:hypothetical protein [Alphaproteobacteria bacterium]